MAQTRYCARPAYGAEPDGAARGAAPCKSVEGELRQGGPGRRVKRLAAEEVQRRRLSHLPVLDTLIPCGAWTKRQLWMLGRAGGGRGGGALVSAHLTGWALVTHGPRSLACRAGPPVSSVPVRAALLDLEDPKVCPG